MLVLYVHGGSERETTAALRRMGYAAYAPRRLLKYRKNGVFHFVPEVIFEGYIFLDANAVTADDYYKITAVPGVGGFLNREEPLPPGECGYIRSLCNHGEDISVSKGIITDGRLKITEGFLLEHEHRIIKYSRRQRRATVELTVYGKPYRVVCGVDIEKA